MSEKSHGAVPPVAPGTARLEADTFCVGCGYNLYGQTVWRDENLALMICRCPECGKFHPAGTGVTASSIWLNRFGFVLLVGWIFVCLFILFMGGGIWFGMQMSYLEGFTETAYMTPDGQVADSVSSAQLGGGMNMTFKVRATGQFASTATPVRVYRVPMDYSGGSSRTPEPLWEAYLPYVLVNFFDSIFLGIFVAAAFFHLRHRAYYALLLPLVAAIIAYLTWKTVWLAETIMPWSIAHLAIWCAYDIAFLMLGIYIGRPVGRLIVSLIIPPKPRQYFAFLWLADGKAFPATAGNS